MARYVFEKHGDTYYVIDGDKNTVVITAGQGGFSGNDDAIEALSKLKATNESLQDFIKRSAEEK